MEVTDREVFEIARNSEIKAKEAYERMASLTSSDMIRNELLLLAKEEDKHREIIERMAEQFKTEGEPRKVELKAMGEFKVIDDRMTEAIKRPDLNLDEIYEIAMEAEKVSEKLYRELASYAANEKTRVILEMLADMEANHYTLLKRQYDYIVRYPELYKEEFYDQLMKDINFNF